MTREEAINVLKTRSCYKCFWDCDTPLNCHVIGGCDLKEATKVAIESLEQPKWIPVTERLPNETDEYLVCYDNGDVSTDWFGFTDYGLIAGFDEDIIAWMERPKPYKEGKRVIFAEDTNVPTNDCISRQAAIDAIRVYMNGYKEHIGKPDDSEVFAHARGLIVSIKSSINALPSIDPWNTVKKILDELEWENEKLLVDYCDTTARLKAINKIAESSQKPNQKIAGIKPLAELEVGE